MKFFSIDITQWSDVKATFSVAEDPRIGTHTLLARFSGEASNQRPHSYDQIIALMAANMVVVESDAVILDFTDLKYEWGDEMGGVLYYCSHHPMYADLRIPVAVITSELNREGLTSLVRDEMWEDPNNWLFSDLDSAIKWIEPRRKHLESEWHNSRSSDSHDPNPTA